MKLDVNSDAVVRVREIGLEFKDTLMGHFVKVIGLIKIALPYRPGMEQVWNRLNSGWHHDERPVTGLPFPLFLVCLEFIMCDSLFF